MISLKWWDYEASLFSVAATSKNGNHVQWAIPQRVRGTDMGMRKPMEALNPKPRTLNSNPQTLKATKLAVTWNSNFRSPPTLRNCNDP